jgi:hypothetical protein
VRVCLSCRSLPFPPQRTCVSHGGRPSGRADHPRQERVRSARPPGDGTDAERKLSPRWRVTRGTQDRPVSSSSRLVSRCQPYTSTRPSFSCAYSTPRSPAPRIQCGTWCKTHPGVGLAGAWCTWCPGGMYAHRQMPIHTRICMHATHNKGAFHLRTPPIPVQRPAGSLSCGGIINPPQARLKRHRLRVPILTHGEVTVGPCRPRW